MAIEASGRDTVMVLNSLVRVSSGIVAVIGIAYLVSPWPLPLIAMCAFYCSYQMAQTAPSL